MIYNGTGDKMKKILMKVIYLISIAVFLFSAYKVVDYFYGTYRSEKAYGQLSELIKDDEGREMSFSQKYADLLAKNSDMVGWISIEDTKLNYPVMLTPNNEEYYLRRNFDKKYEFRGTLFLNKEANLKNRDDNMIIYGHNMDDGTMLGSLRKYTRYSYYQEHKYIRFENLYDNGLYEIAYVFKTVDQKSHSLYINYYDFLNASSKEEFDKQMKLYANASFYKTGVTPVYGDKLITLSTCEYSNNHGRLVVVAKRIDEQK